MPTNRLSAGCAVLICTVLLSSCTTRLGNFTLISTKNVDFNNAQVDMQKSVMVTEEDCAPTVLIFPIGRPDLKEAVDNALEQGRGNLMIDQVSYYRRWYIPLIFGLRCMVAEGTVVNVMPQPK